MVVEVKKSKIMAIPATNAHLWPAGNIPDGSIYFPGRIFVGGLSSEKNPEGPITEADLEKFFAPYGKVTDVKMIQHHEDRSFRGYAFVTFDKKESADKIFEQYSDANKRINFKIKGLDLKIGHAVRKGGGSSPTFMANQATARANFQYNCQMANFYNQQYQQQLSQLSSAAAYSPNPYFVGSMGAVTDPALTAAFLQLQNPMLSIPTNPNPNTTLLAPGKVATPVAGAINSPQNGKLIETTNPHQSMGREFISNGNAVNSPTYVNSPISSPQAVMNSMTGPIDAISSSVNPAATAQALLNPLNLRQNPFNYNPYNLQLLPQLGMGQPGAISPYCNAAGIQSTGPYDQTAFLNTNYLCLPHTNGYIAPPSVPSAQPVNDLEVSNDSYANSKVAMGIFDPPPAKALNLASTIATATLPHIATRVQSDLSVVPISYENQIPPGHPVQFANSPQVEAISTVPATHPSTLPAPEPTQDLQPRNFRNVIESEPMYYQKNPTF